MGPIFDLWGVEKGGRNSTEFVKVYNNIQLKVASASNLVFPLLKYKNFMEHQFFSLEWLHLSLRSLKSQ